MKENPYDQQAFFEAYSRFPRSVEGLRAAGEWHALQALLPDFSGKRVLDLGCGFGWHCMYAAEHGAAQVIGTDISENMLSVAREKTTHTNVTYKRMAMEDMDFAPASFDVALSSLALHYVEDYAGVCRSVWDCLADGGQFIFSVEHPVFTAQGPQDWAYGEAGERLFWPVDRYFLQGEREAIFLGERIKKYHRTITNYVQTLLGQGFRLDAMVEPQPEERLLAEVDGMEDELRRPMMMLFAVTKPE